MATKIEDLLNNDAFTNRHIGSSSEQKNQMLDYLGFDNLDKLIDEIVPDIIRRKEPMNIADGMSELAALKQLRNLARMNIRYKSFIGQGYYNAITPPVIQRNIQENPAWYSAYTPYQPEISQGRLEALMNFQTMISDLTGMDLANASMLDEATACAEAMALCHRVSKSKSNVFFVANDCYAQNIEVIKTRAEPLNIEVVIGDPLVELKELDCFGVLLQYPNTYGGFSDYSNLIESVHQKKALVAISADLLSLTLLKPPGEMGADLVVGNTQRFGVPIGYGGPHAAYMSINDKYKRSMPGRIIGASVDTKGRLAYRLALQTREQHIRREKATSNICTAQALLAIMAGFYAAYHGPEGLKQIATSVHAKATNLAKAINGLGFNLQSAAFFDTLTIHVGSATEEIVAAAYHKNINIRLFDDEHITISLDEATTDHEIENLIEESKSKSFEKVLFALGIRFVGETVAKTLAQSLGDLETIRDASFDELVAIDEIGDKIALSINEYFTVEQNLNLIERLTAHGLNMKTTEQHKISDIFDGKSFVVSGVFKAFSRNELKKLIEMNGGKNVGSISRKTSYVLAGAKMGPAKLKKATDLDVVILSEDEFVAMLHNE